MGEITNTYYMLGGKLYGKRVRGRRSHRLFVTVSKRRKYKSMYVKTNYAISLQQYDGDEFQMSGRFIIQKLIKIK
jgi:hypothetical protein